MGTSIKLIAGVLFLAVKVRLRIRSKACGREITVNALVNMCFETPTPRSSFRYIRRGSSGSIPPASESIVELGTAGGPVRVFLLRYAIFIRVLTEDRVVRPMEANAVISSIEEDMSL